MSITNLFEHFWLSLCAETCLSDGDELTIYVPIKLYQKLAYELSQIQRYPDPETGGHLPEIILFNMFRIRPEQELEYLKSIAKEAKKEL